MENRLNINIKMVQMNGGGEFTSCYSCNFFVIMVLGIKSLVLIRLNKMASSKENIATLLKKGCVY